MVEIANKEAGKRDSCLQSCMLFWDGLSTRSVGRHVQLCVDAAVYITMSAKWMTPYTQTNEMPCAIESNTFHLGPGQYGRKLTIWKKKKTRNKKGKMRRTRPSSRSKKPTKVNGTLSSRFLTLRR